MAIVGGAGHRSYVAPSFIVLRSMRRTDYQIPSDYGCPIIGTAGQAFLSGSKGESIQKKDADADTTPKSGAESGRISVATSKYSVRRMKMENRGLNLSVIPACRQAELIRTIAVELWAQAGVLAVWLGGSFGRGDFDNESDLDFRVWGTRETITHLRDAPLGRVLQTPVVGEARLDLGSYQIRHCLTGAGIFVDLALISALDTVSPERTLVLGTRDEATARRLTAFGERVIAPPPERAVPERIDRLLTEFWMTSAKHRKAIARGFTEMVQFGLQEERLIILKLLYILSTGEEAQREQFAGIHGLSRLLRAVRGVSPRDLSIVFGLPARTRGEIETVIATHRNLMTEVGRELVKRFNRAYPTELERTVRDQDTTDSHGLKPVLE